MISPKFRSAVIRRVSILTALAVAACMLVTVQSCMEYKKSDNSHTTGTMTMICDQTFENIMNLEIDVFEYQYPEAHVLARFGPQSEVLDSLMSLNTRTVVMARDITKAERQALKNKGRTVRSTKIAVDAVALIVNNDNPCTKLTLKEISSILSGTTANWNELEPNDMGEISVIFDDKGSSLVSYMRDSLLDGKALGANVYAQGSPAEVVKAVRENKNAIGVLGVTWLTSDLSGIDMADSTETDSAFAKQMLGDEAVQGSSLTNKVKVLRVYNEKDATAYKPYQEYIFNGSYPLFRQIYMITTGVSGSLESGFYAFVTGDIGQKIIMKTGILPARVNVQVVELVDK